LWGDANAQPNHLHFENVEFDGAHYGVKTTNTTDHTVPFMVTMERLWFQRQAGPSISVISSSGKPGWKIDGVYVSAASGGNAPASNEYVVEGTGLNLELSNFIVDAWPNLRHFYFTGHSIPIIMRNVQMGESGVYTDYENLNMCYIANGGVDASNINFGGTFNSPGNTSYMFALDGNTTAVSRLRNLSFLGGTLTAGSIYPIDAYQTSFYAEDILGTQWTAVPINPSRSDSVAALKGYNGYYTHPATKTTDYTALRTDEVILVDASGGARTITLPAAASMTGKRYTIKRTSASNNVIIEGNASETIDAAANKTITTQHGFVEVLCDGAGWQIIASGGTIT
jgi:hypothetical protein